MRALICLLATCASTLGLGQSATVRGNVIDATSGEPVAFATVQLLGASGVGTTTDYEGFFTLAGLDPGSYTLAASYVGYDTARADVQLGPDAVEYVRLLVTEGVSLGAVEVSAARTERRTEVKVSAVTLTPTDLQAIPTTGGEGDLAQFLPVLPGIVTTGDQGGQIYIRGGAPIQTKVLLDGVTIFNPFHSIGFYSVFETEAIRSVDVLTGGFDAQYGGRMSAVVDVNTRTGDVKRFSGLVGANPLQARALLEGPLKPLADDGQGGAVSFLVSGKRGYLDESSQSIYSYANDSVGLPYSFTDLYGKVSILGGNGSQADVFAFNYVDDAVFPEVAYGWSTFGAGTTFKLVPRASGIVVDGAISFSNYDSELAVPGDDDRTSSLTNYVAKFNFTNFAGSNTLRYGFAFNGVQTDFNFVNGFGTPLQLRNDNTEIAGYLTYKRAWDRLVVEPGLRLQYYASQSTLRLEPRLGVKVNATESVRFKLAGGLFSQNLLSSVSEEDVVNLFVGFISGPEETVFDFSGDPLPNRIQTAVHAIGGVEIDLAPGVLLNVEPYWKDFDQLLAINRDKRTTAEPDFVLETGDAYGVDVSIAYDRGQLYAYGAYSYGKVERDDGEQVYPTVFDRRHNLNLVGSYRFGDDAWEASARYNFGTGFPFTATRGFYAREAFAEGLNTDIFANNPELGILFSEARNGNRLPNYHRVDASLKRTFEFSAHSRLELVASVTNVANRDNVFFVNRVDNTRVDQLPVLPSLGATFFW